MPQFIKNEDLTYSEQTLTPFDPTATQNQIDSLKEQAAAAADLASRNAIASFQPQIDALQVKLDAFNEQFPQP